VLFAIEEQPAALPASIKPSGLHLNA